MIGGRFNIFRAYTGYLKTRSNQKEVTHASWVNRRNVGLSLLQANEFDAKDSLILEPKISYYPEIKVRLMQHHRSFIFALQKGAF